MAHYPWYVWTPVLIGVIGILALTAVGLFREAGGRIAAGFAVAWSAWIAVSAVLAYRGVYRQVGNPPWIAVASGGLYFAGWESLYDVATLKLIDEFNQYTTPIESRPSWSISSEIYDGD